ncbi:stress-inducible protein [Streptomyces ruber]|uniref:Stress-inducible protein n=2 Tax=Streptomyces TaxID=1883 RepID=A0A918BNG8_9ACTN|nr:universal stress protein [Streptomyces ruber]GGQ82237.1 stress-inducible protein [Streptomyces ruber]
MPRTVTVGLDGLPESRAAADWAAREADLLGRPLKLVHVPETLPGPLHQLPFYGTETHQRWTERVLDETAEGLRLRHPGVEVTVEQMDGRPGEVLCAAAQGAELLVLGSRGLGGAGGWLLGSVGLFVVARAERPVVLVRAGEQAADEHEMDPAGVPSAATVFRPVVLGLDTACPDESLLAFAFGAACRRATSLRVVHGWEAPPSSAYGLARGPGPDEALARSETAALDDVLRPWRQAFRRVEVSGRARCGSPAAQVIGACRDACLVVVGRRARRGPAGARIGPVTHAVLHHAAVPVAVVPHC